MAGEGGAAALESSVNCGPWRQAGPEGCPVVLIAATGHFIPPGVLRIDRKGSPTGLSNTPGVSVVVLGGEAGRRLAPARPVGAYETLRRPGGAAVVMAISQPDASSKLVAV